MHGLYLSTVQCTDQTQHRAPAIRMVMWTRKKAPQSCFTVRQSTWKTRPLEIKERKQQERESCPANKPLPCFHKQLQTYEIWIAIDFSSWGHYTLCFTHSRHLFGQQTDKFCRMSSVIFAQSRALHCGLSSLTLVPPKNLLARASLIKTWNNAITGLKSWQKLTRECFATFCVPVKNK